jgi:hypothetical protein
MKKTACFALAALFAASAAAQESTRPHPADPKVGLPSPTYESALRDYRPYVNPQVRPWREANQEVGKSGGHAGHSRKDDAVDKSAAKPPAAGHGMHEHKGAHK